MRKAKYMMMAVTVSDVYQIQKNKILWLGHRESDYTPGWYDEKLLKYEDENEESI